MVRKKCISTNVDRLFSVISHALWVVLPFLLAGCFFSPSSNVLMAGRPAGNHIQKVAVLPFVNQTQIANASDIVTRAFIQEIFRRQTMQVEFPGNIKNYLINERIILRKGLNAENIRQIGKRFDVDAVIVGCVNDFVDTTGRNKNQMPRVSVSARMITSDTCTIVWMGQNSRNGDDYETVLNFGRISSAAELTRKVVREMIETI